MGYRELITESEAAAIAGVSVSTLLRFAEAGYLQIENDPDGLRLFAREELNAVFALGGESDEEENTPDESAMASPEGTPENEKPLRERIEQISTSDKHETIAVADIWSNQAAPLAGDETGGTKKREPQVAQEERPASGPAKSATPDVAHLQREVTRFRNLSDMLERLLDQRDREVAELKQERNWLRTRVERFEQKQERDQLLLLAETQTIRKLVYAAEQRRSPVRMVIEWFKGSPNGAPPVARLVEHTSDATKSGAVEPSSPGDVSASPESEPAEKR